MLNYQIFKFNYKSKISKYLIKANAHISFEFDENS